MNKLKLTFLLAFLCQLSFGQVKTSKNEFSVSTLNYAKYPFFFAHFEGPYLFNQGVNVFYKRKLNDEIYIRINQSYYKTHIINKPGNGFVGYGGEDKGTEYNSTLGFEIRHYKSKKNKLMVYSGIDLTGIFNKNKSIRDYGKYSIEKIKGFGLQPFTGITYSLPKNIVINFETSILLGAVNSNNSEPGAEETLGDVIFFNQFFPIRLISIGYKF